MKKFLLLAGDYYSPRQGTDNWIGCFATREEAENAIIKEPDEHKGKTYYKYKTNDTDYVEWYEVVDLEEWMNK
jgi:hypothetical protein